MQMAAVMAAMEVVCAPNSPEIADKSPVVTSPACTGGA